ncbi:MAG: sigma-70 family RNA polymerase sigma factor [Thermomonas sp.]
MPAASSFAINVPERLLRRARDGERAALEQLCRWFERPVFTLALRLTGDRDEAQDVLQETMLKAIGKLGEFRGESPFWGWMRQIAVNETLMSLRQRRRMEDSLDDDGFEPVDASPPPSAAADAAALWRALEQLPAATRAVLWLYHAEGHTHEEIATLMQRTPSFSKSQLARGGRRLRALLEPQSLHAPEVQHA